MIFEKFITDIKTKNLPYSEPFKLEQLLTDEVEVSRWEVKGYRQMNCQFKMVFSPFAPPFSSCIDPQQQALNWIRKKEEKNNLKESSFNCLTF